MKRPANRVAFVGVSAPGYRSLALGYVRAYAQADRRLSDVGFTTLELDTSLDPWWIAYRALGLNADVVAFSVVCFNARAVYEAARIIGAASPDTRIVVGGPEVGPIAEEVLRARPFVDAVVRGEGEASFADLVAEWANGRDGSRVDGVTVRRADGRIVSAPDRPLIADLDSIPSPYLTGVLEPAEGSAYIETYRGCPHRCAYCYEGKGYGRIRHFSDTRVAEEVEFLSARVRAFSFIDPVFNLTPSRLAALCDIMQVHAARGVRLHTIEVDVERITPAEAGMLARAGVASVETGPQSTGATALEICRRAFDRTAFERGVEALKDAGISVECDLIIGLPGDTERDVVAGIDFAVSLDPGKVQLSTLHVLPGTDLWHHAEELGLVFDPEPPHEVISTRELGFTELRRLEVLGTAITTAYGARSVRPRREDGRNP